MNSWSTSGMLTHYSSYFTVFTLSGYAYTYAHVAIFGKCSSVTVMLQVDLENTHDHCRLTHLLKSCWRLEKSLLVSSQHHDILLTFLGFCFSWPQLWGSLKNFYDRTSNSTLSCGIPILVLELAGKWRWRRRPNYWWSLWFYTCLLSPWDSRRLSALDLQW